VRGDWIGPVHALLEIGIFRRCLKIAPTEGLRVDKEGILVWVPRMTWRRILELFGGVR